MSYDLDDASIDTSGTPSANGDLNMRLQEMRYQRAQAAALVDIAFSLHAIADKMGMR
jgi:hypothetical protein